MAAAYTELFRKIAPRALLLAGFTLVLAAKAASTPAPADLGETCLKVFHPDRPKLAEEFYSNNSPKYADAILDRAALGIFAQFESYVTDAKGRTRIIKNFEQAEALKRGLSDRWQRNQKSSVQQAFSPSSGLDVQEFDQNHVIVKVRTGGIEGHPVYPAIIASPFERAVRNRLLLMHVRLATRTYRAGNLIANETRSGFKMIDDYVDHVFAGYLPTTFLLFQKNIWQEQVRDLNRLKVTYDAASIESERTRILTETAEDSYPFFARLGIVQSDNLRSKTPQSDVEYKRLFRNENEDPLGFLPDQGQEISQKLPLQFYAWLFAHVPQRSTIQVDAHTPLHVRWYETLGFKTVAHEFSTRWNIESAIMKSPVEKLRQHLRKKIESLP